MRCRNDILIFFLMCFCKVIFVSFFLIENLKYSSIVERNSKRRQVKPSEALLDIDDLGESSDDSDFRIEDHCLESDSSDNSGSSNTSDGERNFIKYLIFFLQFKHMFRWKRF